MTPLWKPDIKFTESSNLFHFSKYASQQLQQKFDTYQKLWQWSVDNTNDFWELLWKYYQIQFDGNYSKVLSTGNEMIGSKWFNGTRVNYAEHIFRNSNTEFPALLFQSEQNELQEISWHELEKQVASIAQYLKKEGVQKGDRVSAYLPNIPEAVVAFLACNSIGAVWSSCSPDFGTTSVIDRFAQIEPKILIACDGYSYNGKKFLKIDAVKEIHQKIPSIQKVLLVEFINTDTTVCDDVFDLWKNILQKPVLKLQFLKIDFNDPIWVLYSSGTTGKPKAITHSAGGILIEHLKALGLHQNCKKGDVFFWYSTTGWMMWNYAIGALLHGSTVVIYEGAPSYPNLNVLWNLAEKAKITHFGAGAGFYISCMKEKMNYLGKLPFLQSLGSTGSPLPPEAFEWIYASINANLWLISLSGGTDICSGFVGGNTYDAVYAGEIQCRLLGCKVEAYNEVGEAIYNELGEMVIEKAMPSMPIYFWGDKNNEKYRSSYFESYPAKWRHGDWIKITDRKSIIIYGRSDATLNRGGVRIGTSEIYSAVESVEEVNDSLVVCIDKDGGEQYMPLFVVLKNNLTLTDELKSKIKNALRTHYSPRHVPDTIVQIPEIPYTISGKKMETPVKKILMGSSLEKVASTDSMKNPKSLQFFINWR